MTQPFWGLPNAADPSHTADQFRFDTVAVDDTFTTRRDRMSRRGLSQ